MLGITVNVAGTTAIVAEFGADRAADTTATPPVTQRIQTARALDDDLGVFQGYELWEDDGNPDADDFVDRARAIVFTNKQQGTHATAAVPAVVAKSLTNTPSFKWYRDRARHRETAMEITRVSPSSRRVRIPRTRALAFPPGP